MALVHANKYFNIWRVNGKDSAISIVFAGKVRYFTWMLFGRLNCLWIFKTSMSMPSALSDSSLHPGPKKMHTLYVAIAKILNDKQRMQWSNVPPLGSTDAS